MEIGVLIARQRLLLLPQVASNRQRLARANRRDRTEL